jgi:hypothetical protein
VSLGNEFDDSGYERSAVLYEAAVQMVVNRLSRETAVSEAEQLQVQRQDAEQADALSLMGGVRVATPGVKGFDRHLHLRSMTDVVRLL